MNRRTAAQIGGFIVGIVALAAFILIVGIDELENVILQVDPIIIVFMTGVQLLGLIFYGAAWFVLIRAAGRRMPFLTCQGISFASIFAAYTTPSGVFLEVMRVLLGSKESGMRLGESTATVLLHRILYIVGFVASTATAMLALILGGGMTSSTMLELSVLPAIAAAGLVVLLYLSLNPKMILPISSGILRLIQPLIRLVQKEAKTEGKADEFADDYYTGFRRMTSSKTGIALSFAASLGDWSCSLLIMWVVLTSLGSEVSLWVVIISMAIGKMIQMTPIAIPGMLGIYEAALTTSLSLFAVPVAVAASAALLMRVVTFWTELPITGLAAYHYGFKLLGSGVASVRSK